MKLSKHLPKGRCLGFGTCSNYTLSERLSCNNSTERFLNSNLALDGSQDRARSKTQRLTFFWDRFL
ncbi:hypothetical protein A6J42_20825 [Leptospira interrogans serovar Copenhageni]|nr:hypothetical protein A6J42_20825 [Leptospira interrogans serovar Copenhageni]KAA5547614.1 hypothetical protein F3G11_18440 [Leptospira interrogans serovar Copenhageni]QOI38015.1 hypothetical protein Lepto1548_06785 [Leptospira interrogans serovar Bataviae]QOI47432.1 hypothetical protein Lepto898_12350 [Leptospira interrogans serovar Icterohaemorrhagiae]WPM73248.1 hypothetical protein FYB70_12355 [Leptospira interrogans serovar Icterohaemorrhagiae]